MGDGYVADPDQLGAYAQQVEAMAGGIGEGRDAANHIMTTNSIDVGKNATRESLLGKAGLPDTGRLDKAYGIICQPWGMLLEDYQQKITDTISHAMAMMSMLATGLQDCARQYTEDDLRSRGYLSDAATDYDDGLIPVPNGDTAVVAPQSGAGQRLPHMSPIPEVPGRG